MNKNFQILLVAYFAVSFSHSTEERRDINIKESTLQQFMDEAVFNSNQDKKNVILPTYRWKDPFDDSGKLNLPQHLLVN